MVIMVAQRIAGAAPSLSITSESPLSVALGHLETWVMVWEQLSITKLGAIKVHLIYIVLVTGELPASSAECQSGSLTFSSSCEPLTSLYYNPVLKPSHSALLFSS